MHKEKSLSYLLANSKDPDQTGQLSRLICIFDADMPFCQFCHVAMEMFCIHEKVTCGTCKHERLRSACTSAQSDLSLHLLHVYRWSLTNLTSED